MVAGKVASRTSASWMSSTTPTAPPAMHAAAVCTPMPPCAHTGTSSVATRRCSSTNVVSSPIRPPDSHPFAITPLAPAAIASRASCSLVTCASTRRPVATARATQLVSPVMIVVT